MFQDLKIGIRTLTRNPGFTILVVLTLAIGIGANSALFSVVNGVLLNPLPFPEPERLVTLHQSKPNFATGAIPYPNFRDLRSENQTFSDMAISRPASFTLIGTGETDRVRGRWTSTSIFSILGVEPVIGRNFTAAEDERGAAPVVVISADLWQRKFGGTSDVIGKKVTLDDRSYSIIGVLPPNFNLYTNTDVFVPIGQWNNPALELRTAALWLHGIGRLKPGVSLAQAQSDLSRVMQGLAARYPEANRGNGAAVIPLKSRLIGDVGPTLWLLLGATGFVLLIACVNVSNLLLARSTGRTREYAIRSALGAGRWRLLRQSIIESTILALAGGALGWFVAASGTRSILSVLPTALPRTDEIGMDARVLLFTLGISVLTGIVAGLAPALKGSHWRVSETLKEGAPGAGGGRHRAQGVMVALEMAMALVLLIGAGLMIRSLRALWEVDPGFRADNVLTFRLSFPPSMRSESEDSQRARVRDLSERLNSTPGVKAASFSAGASPLQGEDDVFFWLDDQPKPSSTGEMNMTLVYRVEPGYLSAMSIPLKEGRFFNSHDNEKSQAVVVVDEVFARKFFPNSSAIGRRVNVGDDRGALEIVGIVGHVHQWSIDSNDSQSLQAQLYEPISQVGSPGEVDVVVRTDGVTGKSGAAFFESIRRVVQNQNGQNVIFRPQTMNEVIAGSLASQRFAMMLLNAFAAVALLLASIGLYGVISYFVGMRRQELGIRLALGARRMDVLRLVLANGLMMALAGVVLGVAGAFALTRLLGTMLHGVSATDPATFVVVAGLLMFVALLACLIPALRATRVNPMTALRHE